MKFSVFFPPSWMLKRVLFVHFKFSQSCSLYLLQIRRRVKQVPLAFYKVTPASLFTDSDFPGWTFKYDDGKEKNDGSEIKNQ